MSPDVPSHKSAHLFMTIDELETDELEIDELETDELETDELDLGFFDSPFSQGHHRP